MLIPKYLPHVISSLNETLLREDIFFNRKAYHIHFEIRGRPEMRHSFRKIISLASYTLLKIYSRALTLMFL